MPIFHYSLHARYANDFLSGKNIGVMVWSDDTLNFYGVRGEEEHDQLMNERIGLKPKIRREIAEFVEYYLTRHGGYSYSMSRPHRVTADSVQDAARRAGKRWKLDVVVPEPPPPKLDPAVMQELFRATEGGAELWIQGRDFAGGSCAFAMAYGCQGDQAVLGYLPFPYSFSYFSRGRFWLDSVERIDGGWLLRGRDNWKWELGDLEITIRPVQDLEKRAAIAIFKLGLDPDAAEFIERRLKFLGSPLFL